MATYAIGITPILRFLFEFAKAYTNTTIQMAFADDFTVGSEISELKEYWDILPQIGSKYWLLPER